MVMVGNYRITNTTGSHDTTSNSTRVCYWLRAVVLGWLYPGNCSEPESHPLPQSRLSIDDTHNTERF